MRTKPFRNARQAAGYKFSEKNSFMTCAPVLLVMIRGTIAAALPSRRTTASSSQAARKSEIGVLVIRLRNSRVKSPLAERTEPGAGARTPREKVEAPALRPVGGG